MEKEHIVATKTLTEAIKKSNNLWWAFLRGIFYGFGFFVGSALLAAVLVYILSIIQGWAYVGDFIEKIVNFANKTQS